MKIRKHLILMLLILSLLLSACGAAAAQELEETAAPTEAAAAAEAAAEETQAPAEKPAFLENLHYQPQLSETVLPEDDKATGTLFFYLNDKTVYAGAPVADMLEVDFYTDSDLEEIVQPWHMSDIIRAQIHVKDVAEKDEPFVYFIAMNASDEPCAVSECIIYSISVNYQEGISFGTGHEDEPFVTGTTTREELVEAYGEPTHIESNRDGYEELFYYQPFNCVSFMFKQDKLKQVNSYYSANVYGALAEEISFELTGTAMENDALILMSQYMDITPYLPEKVSEEESTEATEPAEEQTEEENTLGILASFDDGFELDGNTIKFGTQVCDLPEPFKEDLNDLTMPVNRNYYVRTGRHDPEEFFLMNTQGQIDSKSDTLTVKGVIVENPNYCNWGIDNSDFHSFSCQGVTEDMTIDQIVELLGQPRELLCSSGERTCFIWMNYETEAGDYIRIRVDPLLNQIIEVNMVKHIENERHY